MLYIFLYEGPNILMYVLNVLKVRFFIIIIIKNLLTYAFLINFLKFISIYSKLSHHAYYTNSQHGILVKKKKSYSMLYQTILTLNFQ